MNKSLQTSSTTTLYCPIELKLTLNEARLRDMLNSDEEIFSTESEEKEVQLNPQIKYELSLTKQINSSEKNAFFLYFNLTVPKKTRIHAKFSFFIKTENYFTQFNNVFEEGCHGWGDEICHAEEFFSSRRKFIVDGKFSVEMKGILMMDVKKLPKLPPIQASTLVQQIWERDDKDFNIIVEDEGNILVHKFVLSARSKYFEAMFQSGMEESVTNTLKVINFSLKTVSTAIEFFYDRDIFESMELHDAFELIRFADRYNILDLQDKLELHITYQLSPALICQLTNGAINSNSKKLQQICFDFLMNCLKSSIPVDDLEILIKILRLNYLKELFFFLLFKFLNFLKFHLFLLKF